jgi:hypothetical protein
MIVFDEVKIWIERELFKDVYCDCETIISFEAKEFNRFRKEFMEYKRSIR